MPTKSVFLHPIIGDERGRRELRAIGSRRRDRGSISLIGFLDGTEISGPIVPPMLEALRIEGIGVGHRSALEAFVRAVDEASCGR